MPSAIALPPEERAERRREDGRVVGHELNPGVEAEDSLEDSPDQANRDDDDHAEQQTFSTMPLARAVVSAPACPRVATSAASSPVACASASRRAAGIRCRKCCSRELIC